MRISPGGNSGSRTTRSLVGAWGNLVNRTLAFAGKYLDGALPEAEPDPVLWEKVQAAYESVGAKIENGCFKKALEEIFEPGPLGE